MCLFLATDATFVIGHEDVMAKEHLKHRKPIAVE
ncbi:hypothetical protein MAR_013141 [Mya arenaria]|uniref:Uncharacterized protein n=1 Tax=Mya arenaria TaxID=6604 RepID=A0ABY7G0M1_MYAAR|nr:hypothetical protein MAR_013141 [Mya arenaria]